MDDINWQLLTIIIAISSLLVGAVRLWINLRQHQTFKKNISPGVRKKQLAMIKAIEEIITKANRETYFALEDVEDFKLNTKDHALLFDTEQKKYIKEITRQVKELHNISVPLQTKTLSKEKWDELSKLHIEILGWFEGQIEVLNEKFKDYLAVE
jgi:hypothetical protein